MSINIFKIKRWIKMFTGRSISHVHQSEGKNFSKTELKGYYNNLTDKVKMSNYSNNEVPISILGDGYKCYFPIDIFQYGLGAFDLYLDQGENDMLKKMISCANWAIEHQEKEGGWKTFIHQSPEHPYSAMAQGEGISLLCRAYIVTNEKKYYEAVKKAYNFMILPIEKGGTTSYSNGVYLYECTHESLILNGWIFSAWGVYDYWLLSKDKKVYDLWEKTVLSMEKMIQNFDNGFWSKYNVDKMICSPFYHKLHIAQLNVMNKLTGIETFSIYSIRWQKYQLKWSNRIVALIIKAIQKIME